MYADINYSKACAGQLGRLAELRETIEFSINPRFGELPLTPLAFNLIKTEYESLRNSLYHAGYLPDSCAPGDL